MSLFKKQLLLSACCLVLAGAVCMAQPAVKMSFQGMLSDIQGNRITNEPFSLSVSILSVKSEEVLWQENSIAVTNDEGWFGFEIRDVSPYLEKEGMLTQAASIKIGFMPTEQTRWMRTGEDFLVSYTLNPSINNDSIQFNIMRMEGSELTAHTEKHLYAFKDQYPFAYLTGGFVLTDKSMDDVVDNLQQWISPVKEVDEGGATRGVKG